MSDSTIVQFLGTGTSQGIPVIGSTDAVCLSQNPKDKRLRSSVLITKNGKTILIDCGPDFRQQMLRIGATNVNAILLTHEHNDHILGLDDIRPLVFYAKKDMPVYGLPRVINELKLRFPYIFQEEKYPGAPTIEEHLVSDTDFEVSGFHITPIQVMHGKLPILGYKIDQQFAYITDASQLASSEIEKLKGVKVLVLNALRKEPSHHSHLTLEEAIAIGRQVKAERTYFTHIGFELGFHEEIQRELPESFFLAYDMLEVVV